MSDHVQVIMKIVILFCATAAFPILSLAKSTDCSGVNGWATNMAFVHLKNAGLTTNDQLDFTKTKSTLLASEKIAKDIYRQIHLIMFTEKAGNTIQVITSNNTSSEECSMSGVDVFVVSRHLGGLEK